MLRFDYLRSKLQELWERVQPIDRAAWSCRGFHDLNQLPADIRNQVCDSYPPNHNFSIVGERLVPNRKLASRVAHFRPFYTQPLRSLLDLSCSKGFFVFDAANDATCERAMGIDVCEQTLAACRELRQHFERPERVLLEPLTIPELADRIDEFGGPFDTVLLVNTYQYLIFGSPIAPALCRDHRKVFRQVRRVCSGRVIFHNRVTYDRLQQHIREAAPGAEWERFYSPAAIRAAAGEFFRVTEMPVWGGHPVWLLDAA